MFGLYSRIAAAIVLAMFLAGVYWKGHTSGAKSVQVLWDADIAQRTAQALEAEKAARARESELQSKVGRIDRAYQDQKRATATVTAAAADGLRNLETILAAPAVASSSPVSPPAEIMEPEDLSESYSAIVLRLLQSWVNRLTDWKQKS